MKAAIENAAEAHRLRTRLDPDDGTKIIPGRLGHIYEHDEGVLGVMVMPNPPRRQYWGCTRVALLRAGFSIVQDGDGEGAATFDPDNPDQVRAAIRAAGIKRRRKISPEQRELQVARLQASAGKAPRATETRMLAAMDRKYHNGTVNENLER